MIDKNFFLEHWKNPWIDYEITQFTTNDNEFETIKLMKELTNVSYDWLRSHEKSISLDNKKKKN